ncbi:MAG: hypothetical protein GY801_48185 [bacterium]|nr:hypothetical protein [bacterium]
MSLAMYPVFCPNIPDAVVEYDGTVLFRHYQTLDALAKQHDVRPLSSFGDNRKIPSDFDGTPNELDDLLGEFTEWFPSQEGVAAVGQLLETLSSHQVAVHQPSEEFDAIVEELRHLFLYLTMAHNAGATFRFEVS